MGGVRKIKRSFDFERMYVRARTSTVLNCTYDSKRTNGTITKIYVRAELLGWLYMCEKIYTNGAVSRIRSWI